MTRRAVHISIVVAVVAIAGLLLRTDAPTDADRTVPDARAPQFAAVTLDSPPARRTLADYAGQPVILNV